MSLSLFFSSSRRRRTRVRTSIEISLACTSRKRPVPGLIRRDPKTALMAPGLSGPENPSEIIVLLIETPIESGRRPDQGIWPRGAGSWRRGILLWPTRRSKFLRNCAVAHRKLLYLLSRFLRFSQNVPVAPVALRILCLQKSIEIVNVLKTNRKPMILDHFFERILCDRLRFFLSRLGAFASRS